MAWPAPNNKDGEVDPIRPAPVNPVAPVPPPRRRAVPGAACRPPPAPPPTASEAIKAGLVAPATKPAPRVPGSTPSKADTRGARAASVAASMSVASKGTSLKCVERWWEVR